MAYSAVTRALTRQLSSKLAFGPEAEYSPAGVADDEHGNDEDRGAAAEGGTATSSEAHLHEKLDAVLRLLEQHKEETDARMRFAEQRSAHISEQLLDVIKGSLRPQDGPEAPRAAEGTGASREAAGAIADPQMSFAEATWATSAQSYLQAREHQTLEAYPGAERAKLHASSGRIGKLHIGSECKVLEGVPIERHPSFPAVAGTYIYIHNAFRNHLDRIITLHEHGRLAEAVEHYRQWLEILSMHVRVEDELFMPALESRGFRVPACIETGHERLERAAHDAKRAMLEGGGAPELQRTRKALFQHLSEEELIVLPAMVGHFSYNELWAMDSLIVNPSLGYCSREKLLQITFWWIRNIAISEARPLFRNFGLAAKLGKMRKSEWAEFARLMPRLGRFPLDTVIGDKLIPEDARDGRLITLDFADCHFTLKKTGKTLVQGVSGTVRSGQVLAVMGPSGAGKTTLLKLLTLEPMGDGVARGVVTINGVRLSAQLFVSHCASVEQTDQLWSYLSCREQLGYAMTLCEPELGSKERWVATNRLLVTLGLESCQHTKVGHALMKGLSGGQKRRLSIGLALAKKPSVLFCDEPTSGLDAASAAAVMRLLKDVSEQLRSAVVCTIHQPSSSVFAKLDQTLVLSGGRPAYYGLASELVAFLTSVGKVVPEHTNVADFVLDAVNADFTPTADVEALLSAWDAHCFAPSIVSDFGVLSEARVEWLDAHVRSADDVTAESVATRSKFPFAFALLLRKHSLLLVRDPTVYLMRIVCFAVVSCFFAALYIDSRQLIQQQLFSREFLQWWVGNLAPAFGILPLLSLSFDAATVRREMKDGMYHPLAYVLAHLAIQIPMMFVLAVASLAPVFAMGDWPWSAFPLHMLVTAATLWAFESVAQVCSLFIHPIVGLLAFVNIWFTSLLMNGFMLPAHRIIWPFRIFTYVLPLRWSVRANAYILFHDTTHYTGVIPCPANSSEAVCCESNVPRQQCWGGTGSEILASLAAAYDVYGTDNVIGWALLIICANVAVLKVVHFSKLSGSIWSTPPKPPLPAHLRAVPPNTGTGTDTDTSLSARTHLCQPALQREPQTRTKAKSGQAYACASSSMQELQRSQSVPTSIAAAGRSHSLSLQRMRSLQQLPTVLSQHAHRASAMMEGLLDDASTMKINPGDDALDALAGKRMQIPSKNVVQANMATKWLQHTMSNRSIDFEG